MLNLLLGADAAQGAPLAGNGTIAMVIWIVVLFGFMYFFMIRPQKKEQQKKQELLGTMAVGDTVLTTSGFYGVIIDIDDDTVIVEFGSNKNCRIPMQKAAITAVEKPEDAVAALEKEKEAANAPAEEKKGFFSKKN